MKNHTITINKLALDTLMQLSLLTYFDLEFINILERISIGTIPDNCSPEIQFLLEQLIEEEDSNDKL